MYATFTRGSAKAKGRHRALLTAVVLGLVAAAVMFASVMHDSYRDVSRGVATAAANLAATVSRNVDRNIELLDSSIQTVAEQWRNPAFQTMGPSLRDAVLFDRAAASEPDVDLYVMDSDGKVRGDSRHIIPVGMPFGDRDYFRVHVLNGDVGLFVSKPFIGRVVKARTMALSRRITNADGSFGGVVVATFQMEHLAKLYQGLDLGPDGSVTLIKTDGRVITCDPYVEGNIRDTLVRNDTFETMRSSKVGSLEGPSPIDGKIRIISFHRVGNLPLIQDVEVSVDQAYAEWWHKTSLVGAILGCLGLGLVGLLVVLNAELARRVKVEAELERLVATDPLTELANRRRFDEGLDVEWRRAIREGLPLAVLMIDADRFKSYNDTYGHPAGDQLIRALANCIAGSIRRPGDLAARYGGAPARSGSRKGSGPPFSPWRTRTPQPPTGSPASASGWRPWTPCWDSRARTWWPPPTWRCIARRRTGATACGSRRSTARPPPRPLTTSSKIPGSRAVKPFPPEPPLASGPILRHDGLP